MIFETNFVTYRGLYKTIQTEKLNIPAIDGRRTILSNHMPTMIPFEIGVIETKENNKICNYAVSEGIVYFENNKATVVCDLVEDLNDVDISYYEERLKAAKQKIAVARDDNDITRANIQLARATNVVNATKKARN